MQNFLESSHTPVATGPESRAMNVVPAMGRRAGPVDAPTGAAIDRTVLMVCGAGLVSGKEIVCLLLARGLRDAGWNPEFMTSR